MNTLIIGSQGLVGLALKRRIPEAIEGVLVAKKSSQVQVDITKYETLLRVFDRYRPKIVFLPASITNVDKCEDLSTDIVNVRGVTTVLRLCEQFESKFVFFSSSYVFDGTKSGAYSELDEVNPVNHYGYQKSTIERLALKADCPSLIIRTVGVFGTERRKKNFAKAVISTIFSGKNIYVPSDQFMNPILSDDLARISVQLAVHHTGIFNVAGDTCISKSDFAIKLASAFDLEAMIRPCKSENMKQTARRPSMGCLDTSLISEKGFEVPSLEGGIAHFFEKEFA